MHPASSIIVFTTLSGAGCGLLFWLGLYGAAGLLPVDPRFAVVSMLGALGAITAGLLSSLLHLGHPERAWRALSQWRTSWLSREGVAAIASYLPSLVFAACWVTGTPCGAVRPLSGIAMSACAVVTVVCTAYIYRSLKPIPRWHNGWVVPNYLALAAMTGALFFAALARLFSHPLPGIGLIALLSIAAALIAKLGYWRFIDGPRPASTPESATGLGALGAVRLFEAPHTSENYLLKEMGYRVARKHARKLRVIAVIAGFVLPFLLMLGVFALPAQAALFAIPALLSAMFGVLVERWLFFAEAKHAVTLYYGGNLDP